MTRGTRFHSRRRGLRAAVLCCFLSAFSSTAQAADQIYFPSRDDVLALLVQKINAETVRIDMAIWLLTERSISIALVNRFNAGVPVRLLGDRVSIFESDPNTKKEFYWLANQGIPIRLRSHPTWYPELNHWKATIFVGQNLVSFGSANYTPFELRPFPTTYKDETVLFSDDPALVNAFKTRFDRMWNDTTPEPRSQIVNPPFLRNWSTACAAEPGCADFATQYPNPAPMVINTARREPDYPSPSDMVWGQGSEFNNRLVQEINRENQGVDMAMYRLTVDSVTDALINKHRLGVPVRFIVDPEQYMNRLWPEYSLTHAHVDRMWVAGVRIKKRVHTGLTHMKMLVTSSVATNASSNVGPNWQRDHNYFVPAATKFAVHKAMKDEFDRMWNDPSAFGDFSPGPPDAALLDSPASGAAGVSTATKLTWNYASFAVSFDIYLGTSASNMTLVANVPAVLTTNPPKTYSWTPSTALQTGTTYFWKVVSRTFATAVVPSLIATSQTWSLTTTGAPSGPPPEPSNPSPATGAIGVGINPTLGWSAAPVGTTYNVAFGTSNPPPQVATGLSASSYSPGTLAPDTTYFWRVTAVSSGGSTTGPLWSFTTASSGSAPGEVVIYASDVTNPRGTWSHVADPSAANGTKLRSRDDGVGAPAAALAAPSNYFDATFEAQAGTRYRVWLRIHPIGDSKFNDSVFVQFSDSVDAAGSPVYRVGTTGGYIVNLWTCADCQSFGWGWQRNAYWLSDSGDVRFQTTGSHTIRVQVREDGAEIDQIVISPVAYASSAPGPVSNDTTIVPKPGGTPPPPLPGAPSTPSPADGATGVSTGALLSWSASGATSYDVRFGVANPPPTVSTGQSTTSYTPALAEGVTYFWQIVAINSAGSTTGPVWSFTTLAPPPPPPGAPGTPSPADGAAGVSTSALLSWSASGATSYDVRFGTADPPPTVSSGQAAASYTPTLAEGTTYFWQIVATNSAGSTTGPVWSFATQAAPQPPPAPGTPTSPSPADGATAVSTSALLSWSAAGATSYDVNVGEVNPPPTVSSGQTSASFAPALNPGTTYFWQIVARNSSGTTMGPVWSFATVPPSPPPPSTPEIVIYANDVPDSALHGAWSKAADSASPAGVKLTTSDNGFASTSQPLANPEHYIDVSFNADAGTPYRIWLRLRATADSKWNDAVWLQFSDALSNGSPVYPLNSSSGLLVNLATDSTASSLRAWGWHNGAYWLTQPTLVTFASSGTHTLRIQVREDGVEIDQIVLSSVTYLHAAPGIVTNDGTIVPKP